MTDISVCLLSGGLDSCVAATMEKSQGRALYLLSVNYGQVMQRELEAAKRIGLLLKPRAHRFVDLRDFRSLCYSCRTRPELIEEGQYPPKPGPIPAAYPPGRDFSFLFMATAWAESLLLEDPVEFGDARVTIGTNADDAQEYPDCRPDCYRLINELLCISTKVSVELSRAIRVHTPLISLSKIEVLAEGMRLGAPVEESWSCYEGKEDACGRCAPCKARLAAFSSLNLQDRWSYRAASLSLVHSD